MEQFPVMQYRHLFCLVLSLPVNILLCCTLLPFAIPPFGGYSISKAADVLLWQSIGAVGWPIALLGLIMGFALGARPAGVVPLLLLLIYPAIQFLLVRSALAKPPRRVDFIVLHIFVVLSFVVVWHCVLNG
jgi:hypothetical protein